jgi:hypothetical protein
VDRNLVLNEVYVHDLLAALPDPNSRVRLLG